MLLTVLEADQMFHKHLGHFCCWRHVLITYRTYRFIFGWAEIILLHPSQWLLQALAVAGLWLHPP